VKVKRIENRCDAVAVMTLDTFSEDNSEQDQTISCFFRPELAIPSFTAKPKARVIGMLMDTIDSFMGVPTVWVSGGGDFNHQFTLVSFHSDSTHKLFTPSLAKIFLKHRKLTVQTANGVIVVYRKGKTVSAEDEQSFYDSSQEIVNAIIHAAASLPPDARGSDREEVKTMLESGGWMGNLFRKRTIPIQQINDFLAQSPPRSVPKKLEGLACSASRSFMLFGVALIMGGAIVVSLMLMVGIDIFPTPVRYMLMGIPLIGLLIFCIAAYFWLRRRRVLIHGIPMVSRVVKIEMTMFMVNSEPQSYVTFQTRNDSIVLRVGGVATEKAHSLKKNGKSTLLLFDSAQPTRPVWVEGWARDSFE